MTNRRNLPAASKTLRVASVLATLAAGSAAAQQPVLLKGGVLRGEPRVSAEAGPRPTGFSAGATATSIRLVWICPQGALGYEVYATPKGGAPIKLTQTPIGPQCLGDLSLSLSQDPRLPALPQPTAGSYRSGYNHLGLLPRAEFMYVVRALYPSGFADSEPLTAQTLLWPAATGFVASLVGRSASLQWNPVKGPSGYLVFRKLGSQSGFQQMTPAPLGATSYTDNTILPPGQHAYYVQSVDGEPTLAASVVAGPWPAPAGFGVTLSGRSASLAWNPVPGAPGYLVFRRSGQSAYQQITATPLSAASFQDNALQPGQHLYYVQAANGNPSPSVSVLVGRPSNASVNIYWASSLDLKWSGGAVFFLWGGTDDASAIKLWRAASPGGPYADVTQPQGTRNAAAKDTTAQVGATHYYKIVAVYPLGAVEGDVLTAPQGITNLKATPLGPGTAKLTWTCDPKALGYSLQRARENGTLDWIYHPYPSTVPLVITQCEYTDTGLYTSPGFLYTTYGYVVFGKYQDSNTSAEAHVWVKVTP